jgi:hypothetical protein
MMTDTLADVIARQQRLDARLSDMIEFVEGHLFVISAALMHLANGKSSEVEESAKQAIRLLGWREREAKKS